MTMRERQEQSHRLLIANERPYRYGSEVHYEEDDVRTHDDLSALDGGRGCPHR
jgi:hypothetical protein